VTRTPSLIYSGFTEGANSLTSATYSVVFLIGPKRKLWFRFHIASSPQPPGENRVARSIVLKKIIGWVEKNRVGRETGTTGILFLGLGIALTIKPRSHYATITAIR
jgi:hypothetical protein